MGVDFQIEQLINGPAGSSPVWDAVMGGVATLSEPAAIAVIVLWFLIGWFRNRRLDRLGSLGALAAAIAALVANVVISHIWFRPRPFVEHPGAVHVLVAHTRDASFPSDHTAAAFAIAIVLLAFHRRLGVLAVLAAALVGYARVYVGDHYPGDVVGGALVGVVAALVVTLLLRGLIGWVDGAIWRAGGVLHIRPGA